MNWSVDATNHFSMCCAKCELVSTNKKVKHCAVNKSKEDLQCKDFVASLYNNLFFANGVLQEYDKETTFRELSEWHTVLLSLLQYRGYRDFAS